MNNTVKFIETTITKLAATQLGNESKKAKLDELVVEYIIDHFVNPLLKDTDIPYVDDETIDPLLRELSEDTLKVLVPVLTQKVYDKIKA